MPPFAGVTLVEHRDRIELCPTYWVREFVALGKIKAGDIDTSQNHFMRAVYEGVKPDREIWAVAVWQRYEDGQEEADLIDYLDPDASEEDAQKAFQHMVRFKGKTKKELQDLASMFAATEDDLAYIENRFPEAKLGPPQSGNIDDKDLYQARLKVFAGMQPKTVELICKADECEDPTERAKYEKEAVQAYFAEMAHCMTEDEVITWQRTNPVGTTWMCEFARVFSEPEKEIDQINYELALNWLRNKYNLLTAEELSDIILARTGQRLMPGTLKKRRERLGLTTKRQPGPRPNSER
ncbi:MAG: hypothetical protein KIT44_01860 [Opitutaceae bacterium]|nr:hypothetical protein [Opitutaceae bacterium]